MGGGAAVAGGLPRPGAHAESAMISIATKGAREVLGLVGQRSPQRSVTGARVSEKHTRALFRPTATVSNGVEVSLWQRCAAHGKRALCRFPWVFDPPSGEAMPVDQAEFRRVMGHFATGVTVITTHDGAGKPSGLTANAVASVSLSPALVLVCVDKASESYPCFEASGVFVINILGDAQEGVSRRFAKSGGDKFTGLGYRTGMTGAPILADVMAHLECEVRHAFDAGDHTIYVGEAIDIAVHGEDEPLLFFRGGYRNLSR